MLCRRAKELLEGEVKICIFLKQMRKTKQIMIRTLIYIRSIALLSLLIASVFLSLT